MKEESLLYKTLYVIFGTIAYVVIGTFIINGIINILVGYPFTYYKL